MRAGCTLGDVVIALSVGAMRMRIDVGILGNVVCKMELQMRVYTIERHKKLE